MTRKSIGLFCFATLLAAIAMTIVARPALAYNQIDVRDCDQRGDLDRGISGCTRLMESNGLASKIRAAAYNHRGLAYQLKRDLDRAIADFSEAIRIDPQNDIAYYNRGLCYNVRADYDRAIADYNEAIRINPKQTKAYISRANTYVSKGEFDRAIADFDEQIRLNPKAAYAYDDRGLAWKEKKEYDRAISDFNEAIRLDPKHSHAYRLRGQVWREMGELDRALADCTVAIQLAPKFAGAYADRGIVWRLKGDLDQALVDQDQAVALWPDGGFVYVSRGDTLRYKGEFARAIADYEQAQRPSQLYNLNQDYIAALTGLGLTYEKMGDLENARAKFRQAAASQSPRRFADIDKSSLETARAHLAALDSGVAQPSIPNALPKAISATSIPTPATSVPTAQPAAIKATVAKQGRRVALVIGNSAYKGVPALVNPQKDAEAIAASLRNIGFDQVTLANNATREKLIDSLRAFANEAETADWAMVYYAGHGLEVGGVNYLVPVDAKLAVDRDIQFEAVPLDQVLSAVDTAKKLKLVVLDACRDNPFSPRKTETPVNAALSTPTGGAKITSRSIGRGLAEVTTTGGTLVVFAAKNGQVALDGDGDNSPFAVAMLQRVATPGVEINKLFRLVRDDVMEATAGRQEPYTYGSLPGKEDFFFVEK